MEDFFWEVFKKSGNINAFLAYKDYKNKFNFQDTAEEIYIEKIKKEIH